jgi:hypothetical protein
VTPDQFIAKWQGVTLKERSAAQEHFLDLCRLLDEPTPAESDPHGERYCFEKGAAKAGGGDGWADVWKRGHFGRENKKPSRDVNAAYGWPDYTADMPDEEILRCLLALNLERVAASASLSGETPAPASSALFAWWIPPQYSRMAVSMCQVRRISSTS